MHNFCFMKVDSKTSILFHIKYANIILNENLVFESITIEKNDMPKLYKSYTISCGKHIIECVIFVLKK